MSLRPLPDIQIAPPKADMSFDLAPKALAAWEPVAASTTEDDIITIFDPIGETWDGKGVTVNQIAEALRSIGANPVTVQINSPGGNFFDGLAIYNLFRAHAAMVTVQIMGVAASAASVIAMAGDEIQIARSGLMMIHNAQWIAVGDRHAMIEAHDRMVHFDEAMNSLYVDRTGIDAEEIGTMMDETTFMTGPEALDKGFATGLLEADEAPTKVRATADRSPLYRLEAVLARQGVSRTERRKLIKEISDGMPRAADENATPRAGDPAVEDGTVGLSLALARMKLARA
ncbi:head maturation protease, ClpP-related [Sphingopyxis macrogoltabida]|uniref:ATP-dependent Clp protease proteolytic subunit n=1 Tax=Sphingopyxis macrogoltabida TaxID=33050 RepID=A0AAC8Z1Z7_SPHMC|nr:head maturation protease, ClpP-related [Sphingopyxis macrogoltabida]ALJ14114.1 hypothetical protein LH19_14670 [Sphingopyxis macrogoltabida]AMU90381.1 hypothetical protein ATM17_15250 [Sphingopyxis macrogoltabida]